MPSEFYWDMFDLVAIVIGGCVAILYFLPEEKDD